MNCQDVQSGNVGINLNPNADPPQQRPCPGCGRCPVCGKKDQQFIPYPVYPTWPPYYPYFGDAPWYQQPTITWGISTSTSTT